MPVLRVGDKVKAISASQGWGAVKAGDIGMITYFDSWTGMFSVDFPNNSSWTANPGDLELVTTTKKDSRKAEKLVPETNREKVAVRLVNRVTKGDMKVTAYKVESEGAIGRHDNCGTLCTLRNASKPHVGCKRFNDVKVANDFILRELAKVGLAKRCQQGENPWGYLYRPITPLMFSKVYTDSETEWTTTVLLKNASDVLYAPKLVDAFNALATANGNTSINVEGSGMHTSFLQGEDGMYPSRDSIRVSQDKMFNNFAKSMRPLLPALYLLGASRLENGEGITRSTSPRQPLVSSSEKYSAVAYRYGALEFRVFDTCYERRDQLLDNLVVMAQAVNKYWKAKYVKPNIKLDMKTPIFFGNDTCERNRVNKLTSLYCVKEHVVLLNEGLRCIKPPYMSIKEVKQQRNFNLTVRSVKNILLIDEVRSAYDKHLLETQRNRTVSEARAFYESVRDASLADLSDSLTALHSRARARARKQHKISTIEEIAYQNQFGQGFPLGEV